MPFYGPSYDVLICGMHKEMKNKSLNWLFTVKLIVEDIYLTAINNNVF